MRVLIDTNVYLDIIQKRDPFAADSKRVLKECAERDIKMHVAWHTLSNIWYISRKTSGREWALRAIASLLKTASVPKGGTNEAFQAISLDFNDFEDALQVVVGLICQADYIITRNIKDFENSPIEAIRPKEFLEVLH